MYLNKKLNFMKRIFLLLMLISLNCIAQKKTIYSIGDSTMANKPTENGNPERGWGQMLHHYFSIIM